MEKTPRFLSHEPKVGDPSYEWQKFKHPKLRKYPKPLEYLRFRNFIGAGEEGMVFRCWTEDNEELAVKVHFVNELPPQPEWSNWPGARRWPFERECLNGAVLELMKTSLRDAAANDQPIYLHTKPKTRQDALRNIRAFSKEYAKKYQSECERPPGFEAFALKPQITDSLGWMQLDGDFVWSLVRNFRLGPYRGLQTRLPWYYAIVYKFVPQGTLDDDVVQSQYDFYYLAGFCIAHFKEDNWRGSGILVDFSDLVLPHLLQWQQGSYGRKIKKEDGVYDLEYPNR